VFALVLEIGIAATVDVATAGAGCKFDAAGCAFVIGAGCAFDVAFLFVVSTLGCGRLAATVVTVLAAFAASVPTPIKARGAGA
jgi:hypothetical protein